MKVIGNVRRLKSLQSEIKTLQKVDHNRIVKLYGVYENEVYVHMVMEYLSGGELFKQIQTGTKYNEDNAMTIISCLLQALVHCHERGIIHRDVKPENLILV